MQTLFKDCVLKIIICFLIFSPLHSEDLFSLLTKSNFEVKTQSLTNIDGDGFPENYLVEFKKSENDNTSAIIIDISQEKAVAFWENGVKNLLEMLKNAKSKQNITVLFAANDFSPLKLKKNLSGTAAFIAQMENAASKTVLIISPVPTEQSQRELIAGSEKLTSPFSLVSSLQKSFERNKISLFMPHLFFSVYRLGLTKPSTRLSLFLESEIRSAELKLSLTEAEIASLKDFVESYEVKNSDWDTHYIFFHVFGRSFWLTERIFVIILVLIIAISLFLLCEVSFMFGKNSAQRRSAYLKTQIYIPVSLIITLFSLQFGQFCAVHTKDSAKIIYAKAKSSIENLFASTFTENSFTQSKNSDENSLLPSNKIDFTKESSLQSSHQELKSSRQEESSDAQADNSDTKSILLDENLDVSLKNPIQSDTISSSLDGYKAFSDENPSSTDEKVGLTAENQLLVPEKESLPAEKKTLSPTMQFGIKILVAFFITSLIFVIQNRIFIISFSEQAFPYLIDIVEIINISLFACFDISFVPLFTMEYVFSYLSRMLRSIVPLIFGIIFMILPFIPYVFEGIKFIDKSNLELLVQCPLTINLLFSMIILPFEFMWLRILLRKQKIIIKYAIIHLFVAAFFILILTQLATAYQKHFGRHKNEAEEAEKYEIIESNAYNVLTANLSESEFLGMYTKHLHLQAKKPILRYEISVSSRQGSPVYDCAYDFEVKDGAKQAVFSLPDNPPEDFLLSYSADNTGKAIIDIKTWFFGEKNTIILEEKQISTQSN